MKQDLTVSVFPLGSTIWELDETTLQLSQHTIKKINIEVIADYHRDSGHRTLIKYYSMFGLELSSHLYETKEKAVQRMNLLFRLRVS